MMMEQQFRWNCSNRMNDATDHINQFMATIYVRTFNFIKKCLEISLRSENKRQMLVSEQIHMLVTTAKPKRQMNNRVFKARIAGGKKHAKRSTANERKKRWTTKFINQLFQYLRFQFCVPWIFPPISILNCFVSLFLKIYWTQHIFRLQTLPPINSHLNT